MGRSLEPRCAVCARAVAPAALLALLALWPLQARAQPEGAHGLHVPTPEHPGFAVTQPATVGIDPVVGEHVAHWIAAEAGDAGYTPLFGEDLRPALARVHAAHPPSAADLWRIGYLSDAHHAIGARITAARGEYIVAFLLASLDGTGPHRVQVSAPAEQLEASVRAALRALIPSPTVWDEAAAARLREEAAGPVPGAAPAPRLPSRMDARLGVARYRLDLGLATEAVIGTTETRFYGHLLGVRFDLRARERLLFGGFVAWAQLPGRDQRIQSFVWWLHAEYRVRIARELKLLLPIRVAGGQVPFNGAMARVSVGLRYPVRERWEIGADLLAPTVWVTSQQTVTSFDIGLQATRRFGATERTRSEAREAEADAADEAAEPAGE